MEACMAWNTKCVRSRALINSTRDENLLDSIYCYVSTVHILKCAILKCKRHDSYSVPYGISVVIPENAVTMVENMKQDQTKK